MEKVTEDKKESTTNEEMENVHINGLSRWHLCTKDISVLISTC